jgi:flavodoxin
MRVEYYHASVYGNGAKVAEEFRARMAEKGNVVNVHHIDDVRPDQLPPADLYMFSCPGRMGKPIKGMRRFIEKLALPAGTKCAILTTEASPRPDKNGNMPSEEDNCRWQRVRPIMNEMLQEKGLVKVAEEKVYVMDNKGPMEEGWQKKVEAMVSQIGDVKEAGI